MSEMESKAVLWLRKKEFRALWGNPDLLCPLGRNNTSQLVLYVLSRVMANCPQPCCPAPGLKLAKKRNCRTVRQTSQNDALTLQSVKPALSEGGLGKALFHS